METTGLNAKNCEIIEIGLLVVDQRTFDVISEFETKIKPIHIETASKAALDLNGYNEKDWQDAPGLLWAMETYAQTTKDSIFFAHNVWFDWSFINEGFKKTGVKNQLDYHRLDLFTIAWTKTKSGKIPDLTKFNLNELCKYFDIPEEPIPHRGINGVRKELEVLRKLVAI